MNNNERLKARGCKVHRDHASVCGSALPTKEDGAPADEDGDDVTKKNNAASNIDNNDSVFIFIKVPEEIAHIEHLLPDCVMVNLFHTYFTILEACALMMVCRRWSTLFSAEQSIWKTWCEQESWYGRLVLFAQQAQRNKQERPQKQQKLDYRARWNTLKQSERRWKQCQPRSYSVMKNAHDCLVVNLGCHSNDCHIYSADRFGYIKTWNSDTKNCDGTIDCGVTIKFAQFSDEEVAIVVSTQGLQVRDLNDNTSVTTLSTSHYDSLVLNNARLLALTHNVVELWDVVAASKVHEWSYDKEASILCAAFYGDIFVTGAHESIRVWDTRTQKCERVIKSGAFDIEMNHNKIVSCHSFEFAQKRTSKYSYNLLSIRDLRSDYKQEKIVDGGYILYSLEGHKLVSGNDTRRLIDVWDMNQTTGFKHQRPASLEIEGSLPAACITTRISKLCVATRSGDIYLYDF